MKILHIGDLHLGKKIGGYSLIEDQKYFLNETIKFMKDREISHLIMAGDIYDISTPSGEAITLFSNFLNDLKDNNIKAFIISGNHDSKARIGYGNKLISASGIYINSSIEDAINPITVDGINYYLIPYTSSAEINSVFSESFKEYEDAMKYVISKMNIDKTKVNIAISHQLVLHDGVLPERGNSEEPVIGTIQNISSSVYQDFTYTALGHIHRPQNVKSNIRYCGSPFPYHIDETQYQKTFTILEVNDGKVSVTEEEIKPLRDTVKIEDTFENIINNYKKNKNDYVYAVITDEDRPNAMGILKEAYPYIINLRYKRKEVAGVDIENKIQNIETISYEDLFASFYLDQTGDELTDFQKELVEKLIKEGDNDED